jgi:hypothetical protein
MLCKRKIAAHYDKYAEPINKICKKNADFFNVKANYTYIVMCPGFRD